MVSSRRPKKDSDRKTGATQNTEHRRGRGGGMPCLGDTLQDRMGQIDKNSAMKMRVAIKRLSK